MDYIELSLKKLEIESKILAENIEKDYQPDLIIFIAKGGYLIGKTISEYLNVPMIGITAERGGNNFKNLFSALLPYIPRCICKVLRKFEIKSNYHNLHSDRKIKLLDNNFEISKFRNILIVDDSVDTGMSMKKVINEIKLIIPHVIIKTAAINVLTNSKKIIKIDFCNHKDVIMCTPMSKDSKEYRAFIKIYEEYMNSML